MAEKMTNVLGCGPFVGQLAFSVSDSKLMTTCTHKISQDELLIKKRDKVCVNLESANKKNLLTLIMQHAQL